MCVVMQMTPDVGPPSAALGSLETNVRIPTSLPTDAGTIAADSDAPSTPTVQVRFNVNHSYL